MKLYMWQPNERGELLFLVMAESEAEARLAVCAEIAKHQDGDYETQTPKWYLQDYGGWEANDYQLTVLDAGEVAAIYTD